MIKLNGREIGLTIFPDKTSQVWKLTDLPRINEELIVEWDFDHEGEFMHLAQLVDLLDSMNAFIKRTLKISYLPYARQDKAVDNYKTFALSTFGKLLNSLNFDVVEINDPHSTVIGQYLKDSELHYKYNKDLIQSLLNDLEARPFFPDNGALKKYGVFECISINYAIKTRDQLTGDITGMVLSDSDKPKKFENKKFLIVDDICDGGRTFVEAAKLLYAAGADEVNLYVAHGLFTKGLKGLREAGIKRIFTSKGEVVGEERDQKTIIYKEYK